MKSSGPSLLGVGDFDVELVVRRLSAAATTNGLKF